MNEFDAVTAAIDNGLASAQDAESLSLAIMRALLVPVGDHAHAANLPKMLKVVRRMGKAGVGSSEWGAGVSELRRLWGVE